MTMYKVMVCYNEGNVLFQQSIAFTSFLSEAFQIAKDMSQVAEAGHLYYVTIDD